MNEATMADNGTPATTTATTTEEGFLADRRAFWGAITRTATYIVVGLAVFLLFLWWWLV